MTIKDFKDSKGNWVTYSDDSIVRLWTKSGQIWHNMKQRCNKGNALQRSFPSYIGCTVSEEFKNFQMFCKWYHVQIGYNELNYQIDKDLLFEGNKLYSRDTCVLIPQALNLFLGSHAASRGLYPQGVSLFKDTGKFTAKISINGKYKHLGTFDTAQLAFAAYKQAKEQEARRWAKRLEDGEFVVDPRVIERMKTWTLN